MKRHSAQEILSKLREAETLMGQGRSQAEACKELGVSVMTFHRWRKQRGDGLEDAISDVSPADAPATGDEAEAEIHDDDRVRIAELRLENNRLRRIVTDLLLEKMKIEEEFVVRSRLRDKQMSKR